MKTSFSILAVILLAVGAPAQTQPSATGSVRALTLREAVGIALEKNPGIQAADAYARAVQEGIMAAKSCRYLRMDFSEGFTRGNNPVYVFGTLLTQRQFIAANFALGFLNTPPALVTSAPPSSPRCPCTTPVRHLEWSATPSSSPSLRKKERIGHGRKLFSRWSTAT